MIHHGSADALFFARLAAAGGPLFILTANAQDAERLREEMVWFKPALRVHRLPDWETLPYDQLSPHPDLVSERLATLYQFAHGEFDIGIVPVTTAMTRLCPREYLSGRSFFLKTKTRLDVNRLREDLVQAGYANTTQVMAPGEYAVRGGLIDLFPTGSTVPYRIDLFGDEVEAIRTFDVDTQRSIYPVNEIRLLPAREFPLDKEGQHRFRESFRDRFEGDPAKSRMYKDVSTGMAPNGIEYYLPLFFETTATVFDYLPANTRVYAGAEVSAKATEFWQDTKSRYELMRGDKDHPLLPPLDIFLPVDELFGGMNRFEKLDRATIFSPTLALPMIDVDRRATDPLTKFRAFANSFDGKIVIATEGIGRRETVARFLSDNELTSVPVDAFEAIATLTDKLALTFAGGFFL